MNDFYRLNDNFNDVDYFDLIDNLFINGFNGYNYDTSYEYVKRRFLTK